MDSKKIETFIRLAGLSVGTGTEQYSAETRKLGAQLLLSEVLEYVIKGLGVIPELHGVPITDPDNVTYRSNGAPMHRLEMLDGLADVAYTMYWNSLIFGLPLDEAFEMVCDNNLQKFVRLTQWEHGPGEIEEALWHCNQDIAWPREVVQVEIVEIGNRCYAVGKDGNGKVRKPSTYRSVDLSPLV